MTTRRIVTVTADGITTHCRPGRHVDASPVDARRVRVVTADGTTTRVAVGRRADLSRPVDGPRG